MQIIFIVLPSSMAAVKNLYSPSFFHLNQLLSLQPRLLKRKCFWPWIFLSNVVPSQSKEVGRLLWPMDDITVEWV